MGIPAQIVRANCVHHFYTDAYAGYQAFQCYQGNLTAIPDPAFMADSMNDDYVADNYDPGDSIPDLQAIIIRDNPIQAIERSDFQGLTTVVYLSLSGTQISELPAFVFAEMRNLEELYVTTSLLTSIHVDSLRGIPNIETLSFRGNKLKCLPPYVFSDLPNIQSWSAINLEENELEYIAPGTFNGQGGLQNLILRKNKLKCLHADSLQGLNYLDWLDLWDNDLQTLTEDTFRNVDVNVLQLRGNPMECCSLQWLKEKDMAGNIDVRWNFYPWTPVPTCNGGLDWDTLDPNNLPACTVPLDMTCEASLNIPGCDFSPPNLNRACTQTGTYFDCSSQNQYAVPHYIDPATTRINLAHNNIGGNYFWHEFIGLTSVIQLDMRDNNIDSLRMIFSVMPNLRSLTLRENQISYMTSGALDGNPNLRKLDLASNQIRSVPADFFSGVPELRWLILGDNNIDSLDSQLFQNTPNLQSLYLHRNPLGSLPRYLFRNLASLKVLNLMKTDLNFLNANLFDDLVSLEWLDLRGNNIRRFTSTHIQNIPLSPQSPFILEIGDNPLVCCPDMLFLKNAADAGDVIWWKNSNQYSSPPQCTDTLWDTLSTECTS